MQTKLHAHFDAAANTLTFAADDGFAPIFSPLSDFWRLHLDFCRAGLNNELGVYSHAQTPTVTQEGSKLIFHYADLLAEDGVRYPIGLTLTVEEAEDGALAFAVTVDNRSALRVNELQYPFFSFSRIETKMADDVLYLPRGLGAMIRDPHKATQRSHTEYMAADYKNIWMTAVYPPGAMSMPWFGVQSGRHFLAMSRRDEVCRITGFTTGAEPREATEPCFILTVCSYPAVRPGEALTHTGYRLAAYDGDWRDEADSYRAYANATFLRDVVDETGRVPHRPGVRYLDGWQRIILKHQYGEILHTYADLPRLWREGAKYGIKMILLFAWWEEGMDNGYPNYLPADDLGGAEGLRAAIAEIHAEGGRVILYANGHIIDAATDYYREEGHRYTMKNIEGMEYREFYKFSNNGTMLRVGGLKTFVLGCHGTPEWRAKINEIAARHLSLGSGGTFFDQLGCGFQLCFDATHEHGARIDTEPQFRLDTVKAICATLGDEQWFGTEWPTDRLTPRIDFTHGCGPSTAFKSDAFPHIFRYTFPEALITNRMAHDEKAGYVRELNYAFVHGLLFDVALYRCRAKSIEVCPDYAALVGRLVGLREQWRDFFVDGKYDLLPDGMPDGIRGAAYTLGERTVLALFNDSAEAVTVKEITIPAGDVAVVEIK